MLSLITNKFLDSIILGNKKTPDAHCIKGERFHAAIPPWFAACSHRQPYEVPTHFCAMTGAPVAALCALAQSVRNSETMFCTAFRTPFHQPGLSLTYLRAYSSLHRLLRSSIVARSLQKKFRFVKRKFQFLRVFFAQCSFLYNCNIINAVHLCKTIKNTMEFPLDFCSAKH